MPVTGIIIIDHGSRLEASNALLEEVVALYRRTTGAPIVEAAHMELAEPTLDLAFRRCVDQGAEEVVVVPFFLGPGRHVALDIPRMAREAATSTGVVCRLAEPLGLDERIAMVLHDRAEAAPPLGEED